MQTRFSKKMLYLKRKLLIRGKYRRRFGYYPNLSNPQSLTEKIQYRKIYDDNPLFTLCSDKYRVRDYVKERIGEEYLIDLLWVGDHITGEILDSLPDQFVVKTNHDSGGVWVVADKSKMDKQAIIAQTEARLSRDFGRCVIEPWYSNIDRKVIVEAFLACEGNCLPEDYKFHIFKGGNTQKIILQVDCEREVKECHHRTFYDENLEMLPLSWMTKNKFVALENLPNFEKMKELAFVLSEGFNYVRVDFYNLKGKIYFGELTFAPTGGFKPLSERKYDLELGSYWDLEV